MLPDEPGVTVIANNNYFAGRNGLRPHYIILHGTAGGTSAESIARYFASTQNTDNPVSSHYVIGTNGEVVQCVSESDGAWANGALTSGHAPFWNESINPNLTTISIEHCKPSLDNSDTLTQAQRAASFKLVRDICQRWQIPAQNADARGGITGHSSLDPVNRSHCPGPYPWDDLWSFLKGANKMLDLNDPVVKMFFTDGGNGTWKCKNGVTLMGANLAFYRSNGGPAIFGLPTTNEIYPAQYPGTAVVLCERVIMAYDPARKIDRPPIQGPCYLLHIDSGLGQQLLNQYQHTPAPAPTTPAPQE
jgi:N-acetyl-anhydromuramyl-L-alanine amidase AmpD